MRQRQNRDDDETWSRDRQLSGKDKKLVEAVKELYQWRKNARSKLKQVQLAAEIRSVAKTKIAFNQSAVSKLLNGQEVPKDNETVGAIKEWIKREGQKRDIFEMGTSRVNSAHPAADGVQSDDVNDQSSS